MKNLNQEEYNNLMALLQKEHTKAVGVEMLCGFYTELKDAIKRMKKLNQTTRRAEIFSFLKEQGFGLVDANVITNAVFPD